MERTGWVQLWAGISMLVLCLIIGALEGIAVLDAGSLPYFVPWLAAYLLYLTGVLLASTRPTPPMQGRRLLLLAGPVLGATAVVLLSPHRGGFAFILLVISAVVSALHLGIRGATAIILWNCAIVVAAGAAAGPLIDEPSSFTDLTLTVLLYALLQAGSAAMSWSQKRVEEALQDLSVAHVELRGTSALLAESSQARERLRISRELHDLLGHQLTVLSVELEVASHHTDGPAREHVLRARNIAKDLLADVRTVVGAERVRHFDLPSALTRVVDEIPRPRVHLRLDPRLEVDDDHAALLVRAVQEIATNTIRHSHAENLHIHLTRDDDTLRLETHDDGAGATTIVAGNGLTGLQERVGILGGHLHLDGSEGFRVRIHLPARQAVPA